MTPTSHLPNAFRNPAGLGLTLALHLLLLWGWQLSNRSDPPDAGNSLDGIQWLLAPPPEGVALPPARAKAVQAAAPRQPARETFSTQADEAAAAPSAALPPQEAPSPAPGSTSILDQAKAALGGLGLEAPETNNRKLIRAKPVTAQMRLARGMQRAHDMAPNKWYEAPKVTEVIDPGGYGRRRYRVVGARGEYCITIESNHAPDGIDSMQHGIKPKLTNCDPDEQAATKQAW